MVIGITEYSSFVELRSLPDNLWVVFWGIGDSLYFCTGKCRRERGRVSRVELSVPPFFY
jgi:hypothetical protein